MVQEGVFNDGLLYTTVARNQAEGLGTFWEPCFTPTMLNSFHEQPPLGIFLQSVFFRIIGDNTYTAHLFFLLLALATAGLISYCWNRVFSDNTQLQQLRWVPLLFWVTTPMVFYAFSNNLLEPVMGLFDLAAVITILAARGDQPRRPWLLVVASACILAAGLSKGPQGLFPLVAVVFCKICFDSSSWRSTALDTLVLLSVPLLSVGYFLSDSDAAQSLAGYFHTRLESTFINPQTGTTNSRLYLLERLLVETAPIGLLCLLAIVIFRKKVAVTSSQKQHALFFFLVGLSASLPLMVTREQRFFYLTTSIPFFVLAYGILLAPFVQHLLAMLQPQRTGFRAFRLVCFVGLAASAMFCLHKAGGTRRDKALIADIKAIQTVMPYHSTAGAGEELRGQWGLHGYLMRYAQVSLDEPRKQRYFIAPKDGEAPEGYSRFPLRTTVLDLYCAAN